MTAGKPFPAIPAILSAIVAIALFAVSIGGTYIYDDVQILLQDQRLHEASQWWRFWTESYNQGVDNLYRPLVSMSYAIQWKLHGDRPWAFHLVNVLLHAAVSALVAEFVRRLVNFPAAVIAGLLFAAHPIHVEAVANIVGRAELMCALGIFGALVLFLKPLTRRRAVAITGCFLLALLSKEQGMLLPALLLVVWIARRDIHPPATNRNGLLLLTILLCWLLAGYIVWRESILKFWWERSFVDWTQNPMIPSRWHPHGGSLGADRWLMPLVLLGRYTALLVLPLKLSPDYGGTVIGWAVKSTDPYLWIGIAAIAAWCVILVIAIRRRYAACAIATICLALTYILISNFLTLIGTNFAERVMYIPSAFFILLIAAAVARFPRPVMIGFAIITMLPASLRTYTYAHRWNDRLEFYRISFQQQPNSIRLCMLLISEHLSRGQFDEAAHMATVGREMLGEYSEIWLQSGVVAMQRLEFDQAQQFFDRAMQIHPSSKIQGWMDQLAQRRAATQPVP